MNRPWLIWTILGACALLIVGALAFASSRVLDLEAKQAEAEASALLEEKIRMSLSRMDTAASGLMILENQRPPHHFKAFFEPEDIFTNKFQIVTKGIVVQPSPLLSELPEFVRLHFEIHAKDRSVHSPQVPVGNARDLAEGNGIAGEYLDRAAKELAALRLVLQAPSTASNWGKGGTNLDEICMTCASPQTISWNMPAAEIVEQKENWVAQVRGDNDQQNLNTQKFQKDVTYIEKSKRAEVYYDSSQRAVTKQGKPNSLGKGGALQQRTQQAGIQAQEPDGTPAQEAPRVELKTEVTPYRPVWLGESLVAVRQVTIEGDIRYQGVWLKADELSSYLLSAADDLLSNGRLDPIKEIATTSMPGAFELDLKKLSDDPLSLVTLPWRLDPGEAPVVASIGWSPLRFSLAMGWVALMLALIAAAVLVRGVMKLSDRRASFVSSVTHELRTPLTTFHLYSDMLAEDMVKDEAKKKGYLTTMRREAERLNHLVENVLAYSRIERGSARAEHQKITLGSLVERMQSRLVERAKKDDADLTIDTMVEACDTEIDTDLTAVEQIVFNLVDNACKYGLPDEGERVVHLRAMNGGKTARIEVCDEGGGIARADLKKLFRPFHKSARDAAHSKPGVGLGLALCRRLARALGGELTIDDKRKAGACFVLELPVARRK